MSRIRAAGTLLLATVIAGASGCYRYVPIAFEALPAGENVRVYVTPAVTEGLEEAFAVPEPILRGTVVSREAGEMVLRVPLMTRQVGFHSVRVGQEVLIPTREIFRVERRELDPVGTAAVVGGAAVGIGVVLYLILESFGADEIEEVCEECVNMRLPIFSLPFSLRLR